jgi:anthranilate 1,2-dioxygenase small subunit
VTPPLDYLAALQFYAGYARLLDDERFDDWVALFAEDGSYEVLPRENVDAGLPLPLIRCRTKDHLRDRILSLQEANIYNIHTDRHLVTNVVITGADSAEADFAVFQTDQEGESRLFGIGRYRTVLVREDGALRIRAQTAILDTAAVPTLLATPL